MIRKATVWGYHAPAPRNRVSVYPLSATAGQKPATAHRNAVLARQCVPGKIKRMKNRDVSHAPTTPRGFTLVELMVTVAVVAILMAIGVPQLRSFVQKQQVEADVSTFMTSLQLTRSEALKRNGRVSMCALSNATFTNSQNAACAASTSTDWSQGWMVYVDNSNGNGYTSATDTVLKIERNIRSGSITTNSNNSPGIVSFLSNGLAINAAGTFFVSPTDSANTLCKQLVVTRQGRLSQNTSCQ
jgi:type IV fimbrial biogenesis protein FimT